MRVRGQLGGIGSVDIDTPRTAATAGRQRRHRTATQVTDKRSSPRHDRSVRLTLVDGRACVDGYHRWLAASQLRASAVTAVTMALLPSV